MVSLSDYSRPTCVVNRVLRAEDSDSSQEKKEEI